MIWFGHRVATRFGFPEADDFVDYWVRYIAKQRSSGPLTYVIPGVNAHDHTFLSGDLGAALALLHHATGHEPLWQELLLATPIAAA